jgi:hypothetical protein
LEDNGWTDDRRSADKRAPETVIIGKEFDIVVNTDIICGRTDGEVIVEESEIKRVDKRKNDKHQDEK